MKKLLFLFPFFSGARKANKRISIVLTVFLMFSLNASAFAESAGAATQTGSIAVYSAENYQFSSSLVSGEPDSAASYVKCGLTNGSPDSISGNFILAIYDQKGRMVYNEAKPFTVTADNSTETTFAANINEYPEGEYSYKTFCWDNNFVPLTEPSVPTIISISLSVNQNEFLTANKTETLYFYADVLGNVASVTLFDSDSNVVAEMNDDGKYSISGDDIQNDGVCTCKLNLSLTYENKFSYYAVADGIISNTVDIHIISELTDDEIADMDTVDFAVDNLKASIEYEQATEEWKITQVGALLEAFADMGLILKESILYDESAYMYTFAYSCCVLGGIVIKALDENSNSAYYNDRTELSILSDIGDNVGISSILSSDYVINELLPSTTMGKAIILNAFEPIRRNTYPPIQEEWTDRGLTTTLITEVTVEIIKNNLKEYDVIVFSGHGKYAPHYGFLDLKSKSESIWLLNEHYTGKTDKLYSSDLKKERVIKLNTIQLGKTYAIFPSLIRSSYGAADLSNSFIFSEACEFFGKDGNVVLTFADAFTSRSAKDVVGFHNKVLAAYSLSFMKAYIDNLIVGQTSIGSFNDAVERFGETDGFGAFPCRYGDPNATLISVIIKNGSFEQHVSVPVYWKMFGDVRVISQIGELLSRIGERMAILTTGIGSGQVNYISSFYGGTEGSVMQQTVRLSGDVSTLSFDYNMVSEEPPEWVGTQYDDAFIAQILDANGNILEQVVHESVNTSLWLPVSDITLSVGQITGRSAWQTGWKTAIFDLTTYRNQVITLRFLVFDRGDMIYDSLALIDNVVIQ